MYYIEQMLPDGPHWYGGRFEHPQYKVAGKLPLQTELWSPFMQDAKPYAAKDTALVDLKRVQDANPGAKVVPKAKALFRKTRIQDRDNIYIRAQYLQPGDRFKKFVEPHAVIIGESEMDPIIYSVDKIDESHIFYETKIEYNIVTDIDKFTISDVQYVLLIIDSMPPEGTILKPA